MNHAEPKLLSSRFWTYCNDSGSVALVQIYLDLQFDYHLFRPAIVGTDDPFQVGEDPLLGTIYGGPPGCLLAGTWIILHGCPLGL